LSYGSISFDTKVLTSSRVNKCFGTWLFNFFPVTLLSRVALSTTRTRPSPLVGRVSVASPSELLPRDTTLAESYSPSAVSRIAVPNPVVYLQPCTFLS